MNVQMILLITVNKSVTIQSVHISVPVKMDTCYITTVHAM